MYRLTRDDGVVLLVDGTVWESALALGYVYGWRPAGTGRPRSASGAVATVRSDWNSRDYFSYHSQHVGQADARALAGAVDRALAHIPDTAPVPGLTEDAAPATQAKPFLSRASAIAEGLTARRKRIMHRLVAFADDGGFTIDRAL